MLTLQLFSLRFVARNYLCVRYLLNVRAANGEHGELGSGWCTGSYAPPTCLVCLLSGRSVHVLGCFGGRYRLPTLFHPRIGVFLWTAPPSNPVPSTLGQFLWTEKMTRLCSFSHQTVLVNVRLPKFTRTTKRCTIVIHVASSGEPWTYKVH